MILFSTEFTKKNLMNGNMEIASGKLAEFIGKGDLSKGMVRLTRKKSND